MTVARSHGLFNCHWSAFSVPMSSLHPHHHLRASSCDCLSSPATPRATAPSDSHPQPLPTHRRSPRSAPASRTTHPGQKSVPKWSTETPNTSTLSSCDIERAKCYPAPTLGCPPLTPTAASLFIYLFIRGGGAFKTGRPPCASTVLRTPPT